MNYPNKINKQFKKTINYSNRGMDLEEIINETNRCLIDNDIALIYKKPTPIGVVKVNYENNKQIITQAYFETQSTLDYNGLYKGKYIEFDAKNTECKTSFPLSNVHPHQIKHIRNVLKHDGIVFLIIRMNGLCYLLDGKVFIDFIENNKRKSIPYNFIKEYGYELEYNYNKGLNYLKYVDIIGGISYEKSSKKETNY